MRRFLVVAVLAVIGIGGISLGTGCKQGRGQRCQVDSDCSDGLICSAGTLECSDGTGGGLDATLPIDARPLDARPIDAKPIDASTVDDATPTTDAM